MRELLLHTSAASAVLLCMSVSGARRKASWEAYVCSLYMLRAKRAGATQAEARRDFRDLTHTTVQHSSFTTCAFSSSVMDLRGFNASCEFWGFYGILVIWVFLFQLFPVWFLYGLNLKCSFFLPSIPALFCPIYLGFSFTSLDCMCVYDLFLPVMWFPGALAVSWRISLPFLFMDTDFLDFA